MRIRINRKMLIAGSMILCFCMVSGTEVFARGSGDHREGEMQDVVDAVDTVRGTVSISGETFVVTDSSRLYDTRGGGIRLRELRASQTAGAGVIVEYSVVGGGDGEPREIRRLKIVEGDFE